MHKSILVSRPKHDQLNIYFFHWCDDILHEATKKIFKIFDLGDTKATKRNLYSYIKRNEPKLIVINGHGNKDTVCGHNDEILIKTNDSANILKGAIVYIRSCSVGAHLGLEIIKRGTIAFIGYRKDYVLCYDTAKKTRPKSDQVAQLFLNPSNQISLSLIKANTVEDAYRKSQNDIIRNLRYMLSTKATAIQKAALPYLWANRKNQVVYGDLSATL